MHEIREHVDTKGAMPFGSGFAHDVKTRNFASSPTFAKVMEDNPELCRQVAERLLGIEISKVVSLVTERTFSSTMNKVVRMDVVLTGESEIVEIEMQAYQDKHLERRLRFYQATIDTKLLKRAAAFDELPDLYVLAICKYDHFGANEALYRFGPPACADNESILFDNGVRFVVANTKGDASELSEEARCLLEYIETNIPNEKDGLTMKLSEATEQAYADEVWVDSVLDDELKFKFARMYGREEGRDEEAARMSALVAAMAKAGETAESIAAALSTSDRDSLYERYGVLSVTD